MQRSKVDVWVGLFVLIGAAAILFLALQSANLLNLSFEKTYQVTARFDNAGGLKAFTLILVGYQVLGLNGFAAFIYVTNHPVVTGRVIICICLRIVPNVRPCLPSAFITVHQAGFHQALSA